jgi:hypothetical protein
VLFSQLAELHTKTLVASKITDTARSSSFVPYKLPAPRHYLDQLFTVEPVTMAFAMNINTSASLTTKKPIAFASRPLSFAPLSGRSRYAGSVVRAEKQEQGDSLQGIDVGGNKETIDSFQKIEGDRANSPSDGGPSMQDRLTAEDKAFINVDGEKEKQLLGTEVALADAMRFKGAAPEIINSRLSMLAFVAAVGAELATGQTVIQQFNTAPKAVIATVVIFAIATLIPIVRGVPRKDAKEFGGLSPFTSKAELINGRLAIIGFPALLIQEAIIHAPTFGKIF